MHVTADRAAGSVYSDAHWLACAVCAALVRAGKKRVLAKRARATARRLGGRSAHCRVDFFVEIQAQLFWAGWQGEEHAVHDAPARMWARTHPVNA
jgi:hypothetical protein